MSDDFLQNLLDNIRSATHSQACWGFGDASLGRFVRENLVQITKLQDRLQMKDASLAEARHTFLKYEKIHRDKGGTEKADVNAQLAAQMERAKNA